MRYKNHLFRCISHTKYNQQDALPAPVKRPVPEDHEIKHVARNLIARYGARAAATAQLRIEAYEREGHPDAAAIWRRVVETIRAIETQAAAKRS